MLTKLWASAFHGTPLRELPDCATAATRLVVTGASTSGCIRATAVDALQHGYRVIVPRDAVGDRNPAAHEANLYDIDTKYGDVVTTDDVLAAIGVRCVIVRDRGADWQVVLQPEHAELSEEVARAWADRGPATTPSCSRRAATTTAGRRGSARPWSTRDGKPVGFLDVHVPAHLAFYRAGIAAISDEDAYAGLLVSMHGAGIYRQRYGADPSLALSRAPEVQELVDAFVVEQEAGYPERMAAVGVDDELRLADYHRLQWFDRFSLAFCLRGWDEAGESFEVGSFRFEPVGPWRARVSPWPFAEADARVLARPPARAEARVAPGGVPRRLLRAPRGTRLDRLRRVVGRASHLAARPRPTTSCRPRSTSSGSRRSRSSASSRTCCGCTPSGRTVCSPGTPGTTER